MNKNSATETFLLIQAEDSLGKVSPVIVSSKYDLILSPETREAKWQETSP